MQKTASINRRGGRSHSGKQDFELKVEWTAVRSRSILCVSVVVVVMDWFVGVSYR